MYKLLKNVTFDRKMIHSSIYNPLNLNFQFLYEIAKISFFILLIRNYRVKRSINISLLHLITANKNTLS